jgi:hypothetical protein
MSQKFQERVDIVTHPLFKEFRDLAYSPIKTIEIAERMAEIYEQAMDENNDEIVDSIMNLENLIARENSGLFHSNNSAAKSVESEQVTPEREGSPKSGLSESRDNQTALLENESINKDDKEDISALKPYLMELSNFISINTKPRYGTTEQTLPDMPIDFPIRTHISVATYIIFHVSSIVEDVNKACETSNQKSEQDVINGTDYAFRSSRVTSLREYFCKRTTEELFSKPLTNQHQILIAVTPERKQSQKFVLYWLDRPTVLRIRWNNVYIRSQSKIGEIRSLPRWIKHTSRLVSQEVVPPPAPLYIPLSRTPSIMVPTPPPLDIPFSRKCSITGNTRETELQHKSQHEEIKGSKMNPTTFRNPLTHQVISSYSDGRVSPRVNGESYLHRKKARKAILIHPFPDIKLFRRKSLINKERLIRLTNPTTRSMSSSKFV